MNDDLEALGLASLCSYFDSSKHVEEEIYCKLSIHSLQILWFKIRVTEAREKTGQQNQKHDRKTKTVTIETETQQENK